MQFFCHQNLVSNSGKKVAHTHLTWSHNTLTQAREGEVRGKKGGHRKTLQGHWTTGGGRGGGFTTVKCQKRFSINSLIFLFSWTLDSCRLTVIISPFLHFLVLFATLVLSPELLLQLSGKYEQKELSLLGHHTQRSHQGYQRKKKKCIH